MAKLENRTKTGEAAPVPAASSPDRSVILKGTVKDGAQPTPRRHVVTGKSDQPLRSGTGLMSLIGADERKRIRDTEASPFRMVCALRIEAPWGTFVGTGWLAGPRTLVTAGHCVYDRSNMGGWAERIMVTPAQDGDEPPAFASFEAKRFSTVDRWQDERDPDFDIGAIHLDDPVGYTVGWFGVGALTDDELSDQMVNISGYPANPGGGVQQWWARNRIRAVAPAHLLRRRHQRRPERRSGLHLSERQHGGADRRRHPRLWRRRHARRDPARGQFRAAHRPGGGGADPELARDR